MLSLEAKHKAAVSTTHKLVARGETHEFIAVIVSETHEAAVGGMCELVVAGGGTHEAAVGE